MLITGKPNLQGTVSIKIHFTCNFAVCLEKSYHSMNIYDDIRNIKLCGGVYRNYKLKNVILKILFSKNIFHS